MDRLERRAQRDVPVPEAWLEDAAAFYGPALDLATVRVRWSRLVLGAPGTAWTCNHVIRVKRSARPDGLPGQSTFVHELAHVWQHQTGQAQLLRGFVEQVGRMLGRDPYDYGGPDGVRSASTLTSLRKEAQAQVVTELWRSRSGASADRRGVRFSTPGYVAALERLVGDAGIGTRDAARRTIAGTVDAVVARVVNAVVDLVG